MPLGHEEFSKQIAAIVAQKAMQQRKVLKWFKDLDADRATEMQSRLQEMLDPSITSDKRMSAEAYAPHF